MSPSLRYNEPKRGEGDILSCFPLHGPVACHSSFLLLPTIDLCHELLRDAGKINGSRFPSDVACGMIGKAVPRVVDVHRKIGVSWPSPLLA